MLVQIRTGITNKIAKVLMAMVIVSFIVWGFGDVVRGSNTNVVARVGEKAISTDEFQRQLKQEVSKIQGTDEKITYEHLKEQGINHLVLNNLINAKLLELFIHDLGLDISEERVKTLITTNPAFHSDEGKFDFRVFKSVIAHYNLNENEFKKIAKKEALMETLFATIFAIKPAPDILVDRLHRYVFEKRNLTVYSLSPTIGLGITDPSDEELKKYFEAHKSVFKNLEKRTFQLANVNLKDFLEKEHITPEQIEKFYNDNIDHYGEQEKRDVYNFIFDTEEKANNFYKELTETKDFNALLQEKKLSKEDALLTKLSKKDFEPKITDFVFSGKMEDISKPIKTVMGYHVMKIANIYPSKAKTLAQVSKEIETELKNSDAQRKLADLTQKIQDEISSGQTIDEIAKNNNLTITSFTDVANDKKTNLESYILDEVFKLYEDSDPEIITSTDSSGFAIAKIQKITPESDSTLEQSKKLALTSWRDNKQSELLQKRANDFAEGLKAGTSLNELTAKYGFKLDRNVEVTRAGEDATKLDDNRLPHELIADSFEKKLNQFTDSHQSFNKVYYVAKVDGITYPKADDKLNKDLIKNDIRTNFSTEISDQIFLYLKRKHKVEINKTLLEEMN
jgi:peptidyl-prolyl cis-trans isomerase D